MHYSIWVMTILQLTTLSVSNTYILYFYIFIYEFMYIHHTWGLVLDERVQLWNAAYSWGPCNIGRTWPDHLIRFSCTWYMYWTGRRCPYRVVHMMALDDIASRSRISSNARTVRSFVSDSMGLCIIYTYTFSFNIAQVPDLLCFADHRWILLLICCLLERSSACDLCYCCIIITHCCGYQIK